MALGYWLNRGEPRHRILVLEHSYHGDTIGAMSVGARSSANGAAATALGFFASAGHAGSTSIGTSNALAVSGGKMRTWYVPAAGKAPC